jgi:hypothetical protein
MRVKLFRDFRFDDLKMKIKDGKKVHVFKMETYDRPPEGEEWPLTTFNDGFADEFFSALATEMAHHGFLPEGASAQVGALENHVKDLQDTKEKMFTLLKGSI